MDKYSHCILLYYTIKLNMQKLIAKLCVSIRNNETLHKGIAFIYFYLDIHTYIHTAYQGQPTNRLQPIGTSHKVIS